jgi:hypothetical protein
MAPRVEVEAKCLCIKCRDDQLAQTPVPFPFDHPTYFKTFRYACEVCGNKRCPHHSDHMLPCTGSNEPGQPGSIYR